MEVGGDFWLDKIEYRNNINNKFFKFGDDNYFVMSGRTAIDVAIQDILKSKKIKNVYFPSYSCTSMLQPFIDRNIKIDFYNVYFDDTLKYNIDINFECDIFFAMNYFGYTKTNMEKYIKKFKSRGVTIIEDSTHSLLSSKIYSKYSDYIVCSLRKWFPIITGGLISKINGKMNIDFNVFNIDNEIIKDKENAMQIKYNSLLNNSIEKNKDLFLNLFKKSNNRIKENYVNKKIDDKSLKYLLNVDLNKIKSFRKSNVKIIYNNLNLSKYKLLINNYNEKSDCLLYVPIYVDKDKLKKLKEKIYDYKFYCPSHWPIDEKINDLYQYELSLVCDQRYNNDDILIKLEQLNKYIEE